MGDTPDLAALTVLFEKTASENRLLIERLTKLEEAASLSASRAELADPAHGEAISILHPAVQFIKPSKIHFEWWNTLFPDGCAYLLPPGTEKTGRLPPRIFDEIANDLALKAAGRTPDHAISKCLLDEWKVLHQSICYVLIYAQASGETADFANAIVGAVDEESDLVSDITKANFIPGLERLEAIQVEHLGDLLKRASYIIGYAKHGSRVAEEVSIKFTSQTIGAHPDAASIFAAVKPEPASFRTQNRREARFATFGKPFSPPGPVASDQTSFATAAARGRGQGSTRGLSRSRSVSRSTKGQGPQRSNPAPGQGATSAPKPTPSDKV